jgi:hypothetical protein
LTSFSIALDAVCHEDDDEIASDDLHLKLHFEAFTDDNSIVRRNVGFLTHLFGIFVTPVDEPTYRYFISHVGDILLSIDDNHQFALLGEFSVRVESPNFSVIGDVADRVLFMKALIKLSDFCPYWCEHALMLRSISRWTNDLFEPGETAAAAAFHRAHAAKIVAPWISVFLCFHPLDDLVTNFNANLRFLETSARD